MKRFFSLFLLSAIIFNVCPVMAKKNGGILILRPDKAGITQSYDEAMRSAADWFDWRRGTSAMTGVNIVPTIYGDSITVKGFRNNRCDSTVCIKLIYEQSRSDTDIVCIFPLESIDKLPAVWKFWIVRGSSMDSISIKRQFNY
jgi:hypothetical protein